MIRQFIVHLKALLLHKKNIENDMCALSDWFCANKLSLNAQKTNFMVFSPKNKPTNITSLNLENQIIQKVNSAKFLGIFIDDELKWSVHINHVLKRVSSGSYALHSVKRFLSRDNMKTLYYSLIHSHLSYGTLLWGSAFQYRIHQLEVIQKKSVRNICNATYNAHTGPLFKQLRIPKLVDIYNSQLCKLMYLFTNGTLPCPLQMVFKRNSDVHTYPTRIAHDPHFVARTNHYFSKFFMYQAPVAWSKLPVLTKSCKTIQTFNYHVKRYFINAY